MNRYKNPYCLDPKETSCPRLAKLGMKWNASTGTLEFDRLPPTSPPISPPTRPSTSPQPPPRPFILPIKKPKDISGVLYPEKVLEDIPKEDFDKITQMYPDLTEIAGLGEHEVEGTWMLEGELLDYGVRVYSDTFYTKKIRITFEGADETRTKDAHLKWSVLFGEDTKVQNSKSFKEIETFIDGVLDTFTNIGEYDIEMIGYSLGGYKARFFAPKYNARYLGIGAHILPWSKFPSALTRPGRFVTTINDQTSWKYWLPYWNGRIVGDYNVSENETHEVILPSNDVGRGEGSMGEIAASHNLAHYVPSDNRGVPEEHFSSYTSATLGALGMVLGTTDLIQQITHSRNENIIEANEVVGTIQSGVDAPGYFVATSGANDMAYFTEKILNESGLINYLKTPARRREEQRYAVEDSLMARSSAMASYVDIGGGVVYSRNTGQFLTEELQPLTDPDQQYEAKYWANENNVPIPQFETTDYSAPKQPMTDPNLPTFEDIYKSNYEAHMAGEELPYPDIRTRQDYEVYVERGG